MISEIFNRWYRAPEVMLNAKVSHGHLEPVLKGLIELVRAEILNCQSKASAPNEMQTNRPLPCTAPLNHLIGQRPKYVTLSV